MQRIHLDTDLGGDIDDLCALALLLCWPQKVEISGITTVAEANGRRAGYVRYILGLADRPDIPLAAGAEVGQGYYRYPELGYPAEDRYWPQPIAPAPNPPEEAVALLKRSTEQDATIIAIGPYTNLYLLDRQYPGILARAKLFLMGGYVHPIRPGFPQWDNQTDWNIQVDVKSARHVLQHSDPALIPLSVTVETALRRSQLERLHTAGGALGQLIARQAEAFAIDEQMASKYGATCTHVPDDIINFQHDPLACAIALGWDEGVEIEELPLMIEEKEGWLTERIDPAGKPMRVITQVDGPRFSEFWVDAITTTHNG